MSDPESLSSSELETASSPVPTPPNSSGPGSISNITPNVRNTRLRPKMAPIAISPAVRIVSVSPSPPPRPRSRQRSDTQFDTDFEKVKIAQLSTKAEKMRKRAREARLKLQTPVRGNDEDKKMVLDANLEVLKQAVGGSSDA
jgi:hypothetical protein